MYTSENKKLEDLIRNSFVLKSKLNDDQIEKFVQKALSIPTEGQEELILQLENENNVLEENQKKLVMKDLQALHDYKAKTEKIVSKFKKYIYKKWESVDKAKTEIEMDKLIKGIK